MLLYTQNKVQVNEFIEKGLTEFIKFKFDKNGTTLDENITLAENIARKKRSYYYPIFAFHTSKLGVHYQQIGWGIPK